MRAGILTLLFAVWMAGADTANSADVTATDYKSGKTRLNLTGEIKPGDVDAVKTAIADANSQGHLVVTIRLNSPGGNILEAVKIADVVRTAKMATAILKGSTCASACFIVFAAGNEKYADYSAMVGVHGASDPNGRESVGAEAATVTMARVVRELGVPASIIGKMVVTPPEQMVWLVPDDLRSMGATMLGKPAQLTTEQSQPPSQLPTPTVSTAQASVPLTWKSIVQTAMDVSTKQYGKLNFSRACQPEIKTCNNAIFFKNKSGVEVMVRTAEDLSGKVYKRDICTFNDFSDVRTCVDFDTGKKIREMKAMNGNWTPVDGD